MQDIVKVLAPQGVLRVALNFGNPVLAKRQPESGEPYGVSVALALELARRAGVPHQFINYEAAGHVFKDAANDVWDVAFMAIDPKRAQRVAFTQPYVLIEGTYMVPAGSALQDVADADRDGVRIAVGRGAAYELYLTRHLKHAQLVHASTSAQAIDLFVDQGLEAVAGVRQPLLAYAGQHPGFRVMDGRFTAIEQAMAVPIARKAAVQKLDEYVAQAKASGFVAQALAHSGETAATVAP
ncbi:MAG TPA: ABC transporter substrate-binding protein [Burkholderiaceae bacterium]|nr:ABC transporter substrate-binding protein [Burkholderiaceae bacterium]